MRQQFGDAGSELGGQFFEGTGIEGDAPDALGLVGVEDGEVDVQQRAQSADGARHDVLSAQGAGHVSDAGGGVAAARTFLGTLQLQHLAHVGARDHIEQLVFCDDDCDQT